MKEIFEGQLYHPNKFYQREESMRKKMKSARILKEKSTFSQFQKKN